MKFVVYTASDAVKKFCTAWATSAAAAFRSFTTSLYRLAVSAPSSRAMTARMVSRSVSEPATMRLLVRSSTDSRRSTSDAPSATLPVIVRIGRAWPVWFSPCWAMPWVACRPCPVNSCAIRFAVRLASAPFDSLNTFT